MPLDEYAKFSDAFPNAHFKDVGESTMHMRMFKSNEEIELIKQGARMADLGGEAVRKVIREGVGEHEVALAGTDAMVREIARTYPHQELRDSKCCLFVCLFCFVSFRFVLFESELMSVCPYKQWSVRLFVRLFV
jgi:hypothetical protein